MHHQNGWIAGQHRPIAGLVAADLAHPPPHNGSPSLDIGRQRRLVENSLLFDSLPSFRPAHLDESTMGYERLQRFKLLFIVSLVIRSEVRHDAVEVGAAQLL